MEARVNERVKRPSKNEAGTVMHSTRILFLVGLFVLPAITAGWSATCVLKIVDERFALGKRRLGTPGRVFL